MQLRPQHATLTNDLAAWLPYKNTEGLHTNKDAQANTSAQQYTCLIT